MTADRRRVTGAVRLYVLGVAGAICYIGGLISAQCHEEAWMIAALACAIVLLGSMTAALVVDFWLQKRQARQMVRDIERWMSRPTRRHGDGYR